MSDIEYEDDGEPVVLAPGMGVGGDDAEREDGDDVEENTNSATVKPKKKKKQTPLYVNFTNSKYESGTRAVLIDREGTRGWLVIFAQS